MPPPSISAVIPTWNEAPWLPSVLARLKSHPAIFEIIVADNDSEDDTAAIARSRGFLVVPGGLPGVGRNAGAKVAKGEVLLFLDADVGIADSNIKHLQQRFSDPDCNLSTSGSFLGLPEGRSGSGTPTGSWTTSPAWPADSTARACRPR